MFYDPSYNHIDSICPLTSVLKIGSHCIRYFHRSKKKKKHPKMLCTGSATMRAWLDRNVGPCFLMIRYRSSPQPWVLTHDPVQQCLDTDTRNRKQTLQTFFFFSLSLFLLYSSHSWPHMLFPFASNRKCELSLDYMLPRKSSLSSDSNKTYCMLGHCLHASEDVPKPGARWDMGTMLLFNGTVWSWLHCVCV